MKNPLWAFLFIAAYCLTQPAAAEESGLAPHTVTRMTTPSGTTITNYETKGNLEVTHTLGCIKIEEVKNTYTPADLFKAFSTCLAQDKYKEAADLYVAGGTYGYFDKLRVADKTARQAITVLIMNNTRPMDAEKKQKWKAVMDAITAADSPELAHICTTIKQTGAPDYYPAYMIQHGIKAFTKNSGNPIVEGFDANISWTNTLKNYLHCPL